MLKSMNLISIRKARGWSQAQLAEIVGLSQGYISRIEKGENGVTLGALKDICEALDCTLAEAFSDERTTKENILIKAFRSLPPDRQEGWIDIYKYLWRSILSWGVHLHAIWQAQLPRFIYDSRISRS